MNNSVINKLVESPDIVIGAQSDYYVCKLIACEHQVQRLSFSTFCGMAPIDMDVSPLFELFEYRIVVKFCIELCNDS